jgi:DNA-binding NarL/FixJ family response regulator
MGRREAQITGMVAFGYSNRQIAETLDLSVATIKAYLYAIFRRRHVRNRVALAMLTLKCGKAVNSQKERV